MPTGVRAAGSLAWIANGWPPMSEPVRVGVVGVGEFGRRHAEAYSREVGVELVGVADRDGARAQSVAQRYGIPAFSDLSTLLEGCRPDAVSIATPAGHHVEAALQALALGCSVLLEKPVATCLTGVAELETAAGVSAGVLLPAHLLRFAEPYGVLRDRLQAGAVGKVLGIATARERGRDHAKLFAEVHPALMTLVHDIDLALWLTGASAVRVTAWERPGVEGGQPALVRAEVEASDGTLWSLATSWVLPEGAALADSLRVVGTSGVLHLELGTPTPDTAEPNLTATATAVLDEALRREIRHFCACVRSGRPSDVVALADASEGIRIADAIVRSARAGGESLDLRR